MAAQESKKTGISVLLGLKTLFGAVPKNISVLKICAAVGLRPWMGALLIHHLSCHFRIYAEDSGDALVQVYDAMATLLARSIIDWKTQFIKYTDESKSILQKFIPEAQKRYAAEYANMCNEKRLFGNLPVAIEYALYKFIAGSTIHCSIAIKKISGYNLGYVFLRVAASEITDVEFFVKYHYRKNDCCFLIDEAHVRKMVDPSEKAEAENLVREEFIQTILSGRVYSSWEAVLKAHKEGNECDREVFDLLSAPTIKI
ncbi:MAG: hypothetical protein Hyperionvirus2_204 [Hyperionvirus sp.]|uniref:Uncharacterized protein n=1 Tax=Hyperionvirus sp. TaxID=2487770 RepID=A0A3G5A6F0_9VIRU|nr:MAG: hypothetical protein Hyperionvirus2_204 [Hyperionvirus sp.]